MNYYPKRITIELTNRCNFSCIFCPRQNMDMELGDMDYDLFKKIIDELEDEVSLVLFFRGESLLYKYLEEAILYAKNSRFVKDLSLSTNGMLLTGTHLYKLLLENLDFISISVDTINASVYERSRVNGILDQSLLHVHQFLSSKHNRERFKLSVPIVQVSSIFTNDYAEDMEKFINYWIDKVDRVRIYEEHSSDGEFGSLRKSSVQIERKPCHKVINDIIILWDGSISICNHDWIGQTIHANVKDNKISDIWNSSEYNSLRRSHQTLVLDTIICQSCDHWISSHLEEGYVGKLYMRKDN